LDDLLTRTVNPDVELRGVRPAEPAEILVDVASQRVRGRDVADRQQKPHVSAFRRRQERAAGIGERFGNPEIARMIALEVVELLPGASVVHGIPRRRQVDRDVGVRNAMRRPVGGAATSARHADQPGEDEHHEARERPR
jgi:hypothetical protein